MKNANEIDMNVDTRVDKAINDAMDIYLNKLKTGFLDIGLEAGFKMHIADIIRRELEQRTFFNDERFSVKLEKDMPINGNKDYIDIVIEYRRGTIVQLYLIELKFKKISHSAHDIGVTESYIDIYNLDSHHAFTPNVSSCYFIFLTDDRTYTRRANRGTRKELPMHDSAKIVAKKFYTVSSKSARDARKNYPNGFTFNNNYTIDYQHSVINNKDYWHFILKI